MNSVILSIAQRLAHQHAPGQIETIQGTFQVSAGTIWDLHLEDTRGQDLASPILVIDYNAGNNMAVAADIEYAERAPSSPVAVPMIIRDSQQAASVLLHRVRTLHRYAPAPPDPSRRNPSRTHAGCHQPSHIADRHLGTLAPTDSHRQDELRPTPAPLHTRVRLPMPQGGIGHAPEVEIDGAALMLADALPPEYPPTTSLIHFYVPDCDAVYAQAMAAGATSVAEPADQFYGDRLARITDPHNNQWSISTYIEDLTPDQIAARITTLGEG